MAYLPDEPQLYDKLTALEYLDFIAGLWSLPAGYQSTAEALLRWLELFDKRNNYCESYSRGMKQKLVLAGALLHDPDLLMLDEPLTGLDVVAARQVKDVLIERVKQGKTVLLTTHILETAERLLQETGGTISVIAKGKLLAQGSLENLLESTGAPHLEAAFLKLVA
jgi:ABC-2 type transport system ATP-binding protein